MHLLPQLEKLSISNIYNDLAKQICLVKHAFLGYVTGTLFTYFKKRKGH